MSFLLTFHKRKNETLHNYNKRYWELYNEIEGCSEELVVVSYKLYKDVVQDLVIASKASYGNVVVH